MSLYRLPRPSFSQLLLNIFLLLLLACPALAETEPLPTAPSEPLAVDSWLINEPDEIVAVLSNGMQVTIKESHAAPVVAVRLYVATGSIHEGRYLGAGLSHLFEHLLHGGATEKHTETEYQIITEKIGAISNAYTTKDHTCYHLTVTADQMDTAVELLADWITIPLFDPESVTRELGVVRREQEKNIDEPGRVLYNLANENRYGRHPAGSPVIGLPAVTAQTTRQDVLDYYQHRYVPQNTVISIAGDIDARKALEVITQRFAGFAPRTVQSVVLPADEPPSSPRTRIKYMNIPHALLSFAYPTVHLTHPDLYALDTLSFILTEGESSRLVKHLKNDESLVLTISSYSLTPAQYPGSFVIDTRVEPGKLDRARAALVKDLAEVVKRGVTEEELARAKRQKIADHIMSLQTVQSQASQIATDFMATGDPHFSQDYVDRIQKLSVEDIRKVARRYIDPQKLCLTMLLPDGLVPQSGDIAVSPVRTDQPKLFTLDNGLRVILRPNKAVPLVSMQIYFRGGLLVEDDANNGIGVFTARGSLKGTEEFTADEIESFFDSRGGLISASSGNNTLFYTAEVLREDFPKALNILAQVATEPTFPPREMIKLRPQLIAAVAALKENWHSEMQTHFRRQFFSESPYRFMTVGSEDVLKNITPKRLADHHRKLAVARNAVLVIYGDFDPDKALDLITADFSSMPTGSKLTVPYFPTESFPANHQVVVETTKQVATVVLAYPGTVITETEDLTALDVLDTIISGYYMPGGWLHEELRGRKLVYVVHAYDFTGLAPGYFAAYAACEPEKVNEVIEGLQQNFTKAAAGEFTQAELDRAKGIVISAEVINRQTNSELAAPAALDELYGLGYLHSAALTERINAVTLDEVKRVAKKYLTRNPLICVTTPKPESVDSLEAK